MTSSLRYSIGGMDGQKYHPREGRQGVGGAPPFKALGAVAPTYYPFSYPYLERKNQGLKKVHVMALFFLLLLMIFFWGGGDLVRIPPC